MPKGQEIEVVFMNFTYIILHTPTLADAEATVKSHDSVEIQNSKPRDFDVS